MNRSVKVKVCGMREAQNLRAVAGLAPDFVGFVFVENSPRFAGGVLDASVVLGLPDTVARVGVFADASTEYVSRTVDRYDLDIVQLHGAETPAYCEELLQLLPHVELIKAVSIENASSFEQCRDYTDLVQLFLFDGKAPGSGKRWALELLEAYREKTPVVVAGGVGLDALDALIAAKRQGLPIFGIDLNSRVERAPGIKDIDIIREVLKRVSI